MKKCISFILMASMLFSTVSTFAAGEAKFYLAETFDNYVTNNLPDKGKFTGDKVGVVDSGNENKELYIFAERKKISAAFPVAGEEGEFTISFDITLSGNRPNGSVAIARQNSTATNVLVFDGDYGMKLSDGKNIGNIPMDKKYNVKLNIKPTKVSVSLNGKSVISDWFIAKGLPLSCNELKFEFSPNGQGSGVTLDNVYVYTGQPSVSQFPKYAYNEEVKEVAVEEEIDKVVAEVGNRVFIDKDFEVEETQRTGFFLFSPKSNTLRFVTDRKTGNKYLEYIKNGTEDGLFDFSFGTQHADSRYFVMDFDIKLTRDHPRVSLNMGSNTGTMTPLVFESGGAVTSNGETIYQMDYNNEWVHFAICMDYVKKVNHIYINNEYIGRAIDFNNFDVDYLKNFRSYFWNMGSGTVCYDNIRFYEGKEPKEDIYAQQDAVEQDAKVSAAPEKIMYVERAQADLNGYTAISYYANTYYSNGKKAKLQNECFLIDGRLYIPVTELAEVLGYKSDWNKDIGRVIINDNIRWVKGDSGITVGNDLIKDQGIPQISGDEIYFPARFLAETILNKIITWDEKQFVVIGNSPLNDEIRKKSSAYGDEKYNTLYWEIADLLNYDHSDVRSIKKAYAENANGAHPRVLINQADVQRMKHNYASNDTYKEFADYIIQQADKLVEDNKPTTAFSTVQGNYLGVARQILDRLQKLGISWFLTEDAKYAEQAWAELESIGSLETWDRGHWLDLAEFQAAFAIGYDWFYNYWTEEQRAFVKNAVLTKAFNVMVQTYMTEAGAGAGELGLFNNRSIVMSTGTSMTAIALFDDDPDYYADVLWRTQRNTHIVSRMWYPDGAWVEGGAYWEYTCQYLLYLITSMQAAFGTDFRLSQAMGFDKAPNYLKTLAMSVGGNNYSDIGDMGSRSSEYFTWFARQFNDEDTMQYRMWSMKRLNRNPGVFDLYYGDFDMDFDNEPHFPLDFYMRDSELVTMREGFTNESAAISFHGGEGDTPHGHWDVGTYVVDMLGERFVYDYGSESYGAGAEGQSMFRKRTEGHNCLVFNPDLTVGQTGTKDDFSPVTKFVSKPKGAYAVLDMTEAYQKYVTSAVRGFMLTNNRRSIIVRDEFVLKSKVPVYSFVQTKANVEIIDNKTAILTSNKKRVKVEMLSSSRDAKFVTGPAENLPTSPKTNSAQTVNTGFTKLMVQFEGMGKEYIEIRYMALDDPALMSDMLDTPIENWFIEDGEIEELPKLAEISVDGTVLPEFDSDKKSYSVMIPDTYEKLPTVTARAHGDEQIVITQPENAEGVTEIKVSNGEYNFSVYYVAYRLLPTTPEEGTLEELKIQKVRASAEPQPENPIKSAIDRDVNTRWSAQDECWIEVELDGVYDIARVGMITHEGSKRSMTFNIEVSTDGKTYTRVYNNMTSGTTDDQEYYNVKGAKAKYVRINCFGTTIGNWNSIKEIYVYKNK